MANYLLLINKDWGWMDAVTAIENGNEDEFKNIMKKFIKDCGGLENVCEDWAIFEDFDEVNESLQEEITEGDYYVVDLTTLTVFKITCTINLSTPQAINF